MEKERNLKNSYDELCYFRRVHTGGIDERIRITPNSEGEIQSTLVLYPEQERVFFTEEEVKDFSLDQFGNHIPYVDGELTILNNYFFDFWGYYLNAEGVALYAHLKRYAYGKKDWCFPNIDLISQKMSKSKPTVNNYMEILERYGFIYKFHVLNKSKDMFEEGPIYKIRKMTPLLTNKLIDGDSEILIPHNAAPHIKKAMEKEKKGLPEKLKKEHEKYLNETIKEAKEININDFIDFDEIYSNLQASKERIAFKKRKNLFHELKMTRHLNAEMSELEMEIVEEILRQAQEKISKPSFDTWFSSIFIKKQENTYILYAANEFACDWLEQKYHDLIEACIKSLDSQFEKIEYRAIN